MDNVTGIIRQLNHSVPGRIVAQRRDMRLNEMCHDTLLKDVQES